MIGMSPEQYWEGDPYLAKFYFEAHKLRIEQKNQELWMQGLYIYNALNVVAANTANAFSKHHHPQQKYLEKPIPMFKTEDEIAEETQIKERQKTIQGFEAMRKAWKQKHG